MQAETKRAKAAESLSQDRLKEVQKTRAREQKAQIALRQSYTELTKALARAKRELQADPSMRRLKQSSGS